MNRNRLYHLLWYKLIKYLIPTRPGCGPFRDHWRIKAQLFLAPLIGKIDGIILGDSEAGQFDNYRAMCRFSTVVLNMGEGGTTPEDWVNYFNVHPAIKDRIKKYKPIWSIGGNCALRRQMDRLPFLVVIHDMFPESWIMLIPPIYNISDTILSEIGVIRALQDSVWRPHVVDTYRPFIDPETSGPLFGVLEDPVHFSDIAVGIIQPVLDAII